MRFLLRKWFFFRKPIYCKYRFLAKFSVRSFTCLSLKVKITIFQKNHWNRIYFSLSVTLISYKVMKYITCHIESISVWLNRTKVNAIIIFMNKFHIFSNMHKSSVILLSTSNLWDKFRWNTFDNIFVHFQCTTCDWVYVCDVYKK